MEEGEADETLVNELGRLYYTYGGNTSAFFWAKGMDDAPGLAELYCRALRKAIEKDCGKQRNRLLKQFNFMTQEEREAFSKEIYVEVLWNLADRYYNGAQRNYLNEIVMQIKDDAPLAVYCGKIITKLLGEQSLHLQICLKVYDALKENQVKSHLFGGFPAMADGPSAGWLVMFRRVKVVNGMHRSGKSYSILVLVQFTEIKSR